jgi:membrane-associated protease RseP (regulator of RpoE activity)
MFYLLIRIVYFFAAFPEVVRAIKIPPVMPLIPYLPSIFKVDFLPPFYFTYWVVVLAITAICHEFSHGIFARINNVKVKKTGFAFFGPFFGAFVEPDEKIMEKRKPLGQIAILSAGSFANVVVGVIFLVLFVLFFKLTFAPAGVMFDNYAFSAINVSDISAINDAKINSTSGILDLISGDFINISVNGKKYITNSTIFRDQIKKNVSQIIVYDDLPAINARLSGIIVQIDDNEIKISNDLSDALKKYSPGDKIKITTKTADAAKIYDIILAESPNEKGKAYLGIVTLKYSGGGISSFLYKIFNFFKDSRVYYQPASDFVVFIYNLLWWIILVNVSVALFNMLPFGIFDGGRVFYLTMFSLTKSKKMAKKLFSIATYLIILIFILLTVFWAFHMFFT